MAGPPGLGPRKAITAKVPGSDGPTQSSADLSMTVGKAPGQATSLPDPSTLVAQVPPPPPPLPGGGHIGGAAAGVQSQLAKKLAEAQDGHQLSAHRIVGHEIATLAEKAQDDLPSTVGQRV